VVVCAAAVAATVPLSYATQFADPDAVPDRPTLGQFVRSLQGHPGAICNSLSDTLLFKRYGELGKVGQIRCSMSLAHELGGTFTIVRTFDRQESGAILRATDEAGVTVYMFSAPRFHQWTITSIRSRPDAVRRVP
jgi:hypothetical protein